MNLKDELIEGKGYHVYEKFVPNILISDIKAILKELHPVRASSSKKVYAEKDEIGKLEDISVWWSQTVENYKPVQKIKTLIDPLIKHSFPNLDFYASDIVTINTR